MAHHPIFYDDWPRLFHELGGVCAGEIGTNYPTLLSIITSFQI